MSDEGQAVWANAFLRPIRASAMSPTASAKFLPASEYKRATSIDYAKMAKVQNTFRDRYLDEVR
jgi:putative spermidine/putrescine transport system substrate-binding protein